tara:strand:- start:3221 stop:5620 length:2400 start_codon:yes stop_codon:yes gene_type:complete
MKNLNEQILRMKQLMGEDRLYGNLVDIKTEEDILKEEWYNIKKDIFGFTGELLESDDKLFNSQNLLFESLFDKSKNELITEQSWKNLIFKPKMKGKKIKLSDMTISSGFSPFKNLKGSGLANATYRDLPELIDIFKKNKTSVLNAMKNTGAGGWNDATMKHMDNFISELEEVMTNANQYLDPKYRFAPAKTNMSSRSKRMLIELPGDMIDDIFTSVEFIGKRQKLKNYYTKIKNKVGGWYDKTKNFLKKFFKGTDSSGLKKRWSSKPVSSLNLSNEALMKQFAMGIRTSLDEAGTDLATRIKNMSPDTIINGLPSKTLEGLKKGQSVGGLLFRKEGGKWQAVRKITFIDEQTGKRSTREIANDTFMEEWLAQGTKSSDNPGSEKLTKSKWWSRGNTEGKTKGIPGRKVLNYVGRVLTYPFPVLGTTLRLVREGTWRKLFGKSDFKRALPIGERGNLKQFSDLGQGDQPPALKKLVGTVQGGELAARALIVETLIYCSAYGVYQEQDPEATTVEKAVQSTIDLAKNPYKYGSLGFLIYKDILLSLWDKVEKEGEEAISQASFAHCSKKYPQWKHDRQQQLEHAKCITQVSDSQKKITDFIKAQKDLITAWNKIPMDCTKITQETWSKIISTKSEAEMELNKSIPWWKDTKNMLNKLGYKGNMEKIKEQLFPPQKVPIPGDTTGATKEVSWDDFIKVAKQRWVDECGGGGNRNNQHGDGGNIKRNTDDAKCYCVGKEDGKTYEYNCTDKLPEQCDENDLFSQTLPEIEITTSQYDYNPNMKIVFETAAVDNIVFLDESDFS